MVFPRQLLSSSNFVRLSAFSDLLETHPTQSDWVFEPRKRNGRVGRMAPKQVERVISDIGSRAGVVVNASGKTASARDLRRSFGQRLSDAGVSPRDLQKIMRHASVMTTEQYYLSDNALDIGDRIAAKVGVPRYSLGVRGDSPRAPK